MDYEKKYKELVAKIKNAHLYAQTDSTKNVLEGILPELAESEDERILEIIKHCIESRYLHTSTIKGISQKQCFAWLEKQGEPTDNDMVEALRTEYEKGKADAIAETQKEWSEEDEDYFDAIITKLEVTQEDAALTDNQLNFLKSLKSKIHPKQEWSEDDVYNSKLILATVSQDQDLSLETKDKLTSWLKSLKERIGGKL